MCRLTEISFPLLHRHALQSGDCSRAGGRIASRGPRLTRVADQSAHLLALSSPSSELKSLTMSMKKDMLGVRVRQSYHCSGHCNRNNDLLASHPQLQLHFNRGEGAKQCAKQACAGQKMNWL